MLSLLMMYVIKMIRGNNEYYIHLRITFQVRWNIFFLSDSILDRYMWAETF